MLVECLLLVMARRLQVEDDLFEGSGELKGRLVLVGEVDDQTVIAPDVHTCIRTERDRHRMCHLASTDLLVIGPQ